MAVGWLAAATIGSGLLGARGAKSAAKTQAAAQLEAARIQAEASKLKNAYMSGGFGTGQLTVDASGAPTASYTLAPQLQQMRDLLYGQAFAGMPTTATRDFYTQMQQQAQQRAMGAMGMSPEAAAAKEYASIQGLLSPQRAREQASLAQNLFKSGRMGAGTSYGAGGGYINPQQYAYMKALEEQNAQLGLSSLDRARQLQTSDIQNYFNLANQAPTALANLYGAQAGLFGKGADIESLGMKPLDYIAGLQGRATNASMMSGRALAQGITGAAGYQAANQQAFPQYLQTTLQSLGSNPAVSSWIKGLWGSPATATPQAMTQDYQNTWTANGPFDYQTYDKQIWD